MRQKMLHLHNSDAILGLNGAPSGARPEAQERSDSTMIPTFQPLRAQAAMLRMAGYAANQQIAMMQTFGRFLSGMPELQARTLTLAWPVGGTAAKPAEKTTAKPAAKTTAKPAAKTTAEPAAKPRKTRMPAVRKPEPAKTEATPVAATAALAKTPDQAPAKAEAPVLAPGKPKAPANPRAARPAAAKPAATPAAKPTARPAPRKRTRAPSKPPVMPGDGE